MKTTEALAQRILERSNKIQTVSPIEVEITREDIEDGTVPERSVGSILTIITIISIIIQLVKLYKACKQTPEQVVQSFNGGGLFNRALLRRSIRKGLKESGANTNHLNNVEEAVKNEGFQLTVADVEKLYEEIG